MKMSSILRNDFSKKKLIESGLFLGTWTEYSCRIIHPITSKFQRVFSLDLSSSNHFQSNTVDSADEETALQADLEYRRQPSQVDAAHQRRNMIIYHIIYDFSNDIIYGCGFATAIAHDRLIGFALWMMIFSEGFRRHSRKKDKKETNLFF